MRYAPGILRRIGTLLGASGLLLFCYGVGVYWVPTVTKTGGFFDHFARFYVGLQVVFTVGLVGGVLVLGFSWIWSGKILPDSLRRLGTTLSGPSPAGKPTTRTNTG